MTCAHARVPVSIPDPCLFMKRDICLNLIATVALLCGTAVRAAEPSAATNAPSPTVTLPIDRLVAEALENNPELKFYQAEIAAARAAAKNAGRLAPAEFETSVGHKTAHSSAN